MIARFKFLSSEVILGTLVAVFSVFAAASSYQSSMADSEQVKYNVWGQQLLTDANAEYLTSNQFVIYDYTMYDGWYTADDEDKAAYYEANFSEELQAVILTDPENPFNDSYYDAMYAEPQRMFDEADEYFALAGEFNTRGDALQLVLLISALGLAFAAWAALLKGDSLVRLIFAVISLVIMVFSIFLYLAVPTVLV